LWKILFDPSTNFSPKFKFRIFFLSNTNSQEKNICNTLWDLLGSQVADFQKIVDTSWRISKKLLTEVGDFEAIFDDCIGVRHWVILVVPRRVRKINESIKVAT